MKFLKKFLLVIFVLSITVLPILSLAATDPSAKVCNPISNIGDVLCKGGSLLKTLIPVLILLGVVYFVWGVVQYVISSDEEAKKSGKARIIYGIIGLVVITSLWGLVSIVVDTFGLDQGTQLVSDLVQNNSSIIEANVGFCELIQNPKLGNLINYATCLINKSVIPFIVSLAVLMFIWGVVQYVINSDEEAKKAKGKQFMIWGIIGLTVMVGIWGLVQIVGSTFGIDNVIPQLK